MRTHGTRTAVALAAAAVLAAGVSLAGCSKSEATPTPVVTVQAEHPEMGAIAEHIPADAVLAPLAQAAISPKITAPVRHFYVQRGSRVKAGQLLAVLENRDLAAAALDNRGAYTTAQATYATTTQAQVPEEYQKAQLDVAQAKANLDLNQSIVNARKQLFAEGAIPGRDLDTAQAALVQAQAAYDAAAKHLESQKSVAAQGVARSGEGTTDVGRGKVSGRRGAGLVLGDSQPDLRRGDGPAALRRGDGSGGIDAADRDGHIGAAGEDPSGAAARARDEGRRRCDDHGAGCR